MGFFAREGVAAAKAAACFMGEEKSSLFPPLAFITPLKCDGCV
jgi:hypothetical protein